MFPVNGRFLTIEPERCVIFSWEPQPPDPDAGKETMVSVWFRACADGNTEVEVRHTLFPDEPMRARHHEGWNGTLDRLGRLLASPERTCKQNQTTKNERTMNHTEILKRYYTAMEQHDWKTKRSLMCDDLKFRGPLIAGR